MTSVIIIIIAIMAAYWLLPVLGRWLRKLAISFMHRRAEDYLSRAMGIDPKEARKARKANEKRKKTSEGYGPASGYPGPGRDAHIIPPEYAEDVEYAEFKDFSKDTIAPDRADKGFVREEQVSDAEWEEIR